MLTKNYYYGIVNKSLSLEDITTRMRLSMFVLKNITHVNKKIYNEIFFATTKFFLLPRNFLLNQATCTLKRKEKWII
jgi:hypothetical protein